jgi:hypothetical protein
MREFSNCLTCITSCRNGICKEISADVENSALARQIGARSPAHESHHRNDGNHYRKPKQNLRRTTRAPKHNDAGHEEHDTLRDLEQFAIHG